MQTIAFRGYKLAFENRAAAESMIRQIDDFPTFFTPATDRPWIIDCGANIGVSVLEWKTRWPGCRVTCFEPDPRTFAVLQTNMDRNDVPDVQCIAAAVSDVEGTATFYGDLSRGGDSRGNSIDPAWGQRAASPEMSESGQTEVKCQRLSRMLDRPANAGRTVDFLKLDIEGAESRVLDDLAGHLDRINAIYVEVHQTDTTAEINSAPRIAKILYDAGFTTEHQSRHALHALPGFLASWQASVGARQTHVLAWRTNRGSVRSSTLQ